MFKPGDKVIRIARSQTLTVGDTYEVKDCNGDTLRLIGFAHIWDSCNFELAKTNKSVGALPIVGRYFTANCHSGSSQEDYVIRVDRMDRHFYSTYWRVNKPGEVWKHCGGEFTNLLREISEQEVNDMNQDKLPEKWGIRGCPELREYLLERSGMTGADNSALYFTEDGRWKCVADIGQTSRVIISFDSFMKRSQIYEPIPERWYIETESGPDRNFVAAFYESKLKEDCYMHKSYVSSHNGQGISIFDARKGTSLTFFARRGTKITIEQFKQLINNHNNGNKTNNEVQRHAESIGNPNSGCGITTQSRKCTIATTNGYVGNAFSNKQSKATVIQSNVAGNVLVSSHN